MRVSLPSVEQLGRLSLRAVVAYAGRNARRLSSELSGVVPDEFIDELLTLVESVSTTHIINEVEKASVVRAAERVAAAYATAPAGLKSRERFRIVFSLGHAAEAAMFALLAAEDPANASDDRQPAAEEAQYAARPIEVLSKEGASEARKAAHNDYDLLLQEYGAHEEVVIGDPVRCFDAG
jgi:hypothetical protein